MKSINKKIININRQYCGKTYCKIRNWDMLAGRHIVYHSYRNSPYEIVVLPSFVKPVLLESSVKNAKYK